MSSTTPDPNNTPKVILAAMIAMIFVLAIAAMLWNIFKDNPNW